MYSINTLALFLYISIVSLPRKVFVKIIQSKYHDTYSCLQGLAQAQ